MNILPIRIKKINNENNDEDNLHITNKRKIIDIKMNNHYGYILYEIYIIFLHMKVLVKYEYLS